ncbi:transglycosylase family protein [Micropruina sp.]|uniref:transglycosylase family protein n=1 Tax=Micropruina sp. TaxID=2737536 RepID=UPI0039E3D2D1
MNCPPCPQLLESSIVIWSWKLTALTGAVVLTGGALSAAALDKTVAINIDGQTTSATSFAGTVGDLLQGQGIAVGPRDVVIPSIDSPVADGSTVQVQYARKVTLLVDGAPTEFYTTATTLDSALQTAALHGLGGADFSVSRSVGIGREGLTVDVRTPKTITLTVADGKSEKITTTADTVAELLGEQGVGMNVGDRIKPALRTALDDDLEVTLTRVETTTKTVTESVRYDVIKTKSKKLFTGQTKVTTTGKNGTAKVTYEYVSINGGEASKKALKRVVIVAPVSARVTVGTKAGSASGGGISLARAAMWDRIAKCESGGNWHINSGNGYYGGLQFANASWRANGGTDFAARADLASRAEQITVANRYYAKAGLAPWGCRHAA